MDFSDYRLFVMPEVLPDRGSPNMERSRDDTRLKTPEFSDLCLTEQDNDGDLDSDWTSINLGQPDTESLEPANEPTDNENRMSKSLDMGYEELETDDITNYSSYPWQNKSRTLDSPSRRSATSSTHSKPTRKTPAQTTSDGDKLKFKLMSAWNNMKFEMKPKTTFRVDTPVWLLSKHYRCSKNEGEEEQNHVAHGTKPTNTSFENFRRDFISKIWFTYRKDFEPLFGSQLTTDVGWGCMLRTGQMMLAQAFVLHFLGRDWRWHSHQRKYELIFHQQIIKFFGDIPDENECPFSIHRLVQIGTESSKKPGDWYGPASAAFVMREAMSRAPVTNALLSQICLYVAQDCTIYKQDVIDLCTRPIHPRRCSSQSASGVSYSEDPWRAVIILVPVRLGGEVLNPIYIPCVKSMLVHDLCIGIIGGRPKHSLYFIGWQEDKLVNLDPHLCQDFVDVKDRNFPLQTYHCMSPRKMSFHKMDPSCTIGYYCRTRADFIRFVRESDQMASPPKEKGLYPMFVFQDGRSSDLMGDQNTEQTEERYLRVRRLDKKGRPKGNPKEADDFVFL